MDKKQIEEFENLKTMKERAQFLLDIGVTAKTDIDDLEIVYRANVGCISLPVVALTESVAIKKGTKYLQDRLCA